MQLFLAVLSLCRTGCNSARPLERRLQDPSRYSQLDQHSRFVKAHLRDGSMVLFRQWRTDSAHAIGGSAIVYDINRRQTGPEQESFT
jgi:hypothetical protein